MNPPTVSVVSAQQLAPQHPCDQRRHTFDFSTWQRAVLDDTPILSSVDNSTEFTSFTSFIPTTTATTTATATATATAVPHPRSFASLSPFNTTTKREMASWNKPSVTKTGTLSPPHMEMHTKEPLLLAEPPLNAGPVFSGVPLSQASTRSDNENYGDAAVQMRPWPDMHKQQGLGALSDCRGASTSQMPVYASIWDQPESMPLHKHAYPFQMNHPRDNASTVSALQRSCSGLDRTPGLSQNIPPDVGDTVGLERDHVMSLVDPGPVMLDELSSLNSDDSFASPLQRRPTHQQQSLFVTSRRNSRALPNPIQPPMAIHVRKPSTDPQSLKDQDPSQEFVHNGFVPGYSIWTSGDSQQAPEKPSKMVQGYLADIRTDIQSQRRKSESVLYDLDMTNPMHADRDSIYQQGVNPITAPTFRAFMSTSARSVSPLDGQGSVHQATLGTHGSVQVPCLQPGSFSVELHPLSPLDQENFAGRSQMPGSKVIRPQIGAQTQTTNTHSFDSFSARHHGGSTQQYNNGMCGLCNVQRATISMGGCGHRVCNVCHRHEKHRAMRLLQSATPPCPFCAHGVVPTSAPLVAQTSGADPFKQHALPMPQLHLPTYANQQSQQQPQQRHGKQKQGLQSQGSYEVSASEEHGYSYNQHNYGTFPNLVSSQAAAWQCLSSEQLDNAHGGKKHIVERGSGDYPGYLPQSQQQDTASRLAAGIYPLQMATTSSSAQHQAIYPGSNHQHSQNLAFNSMIDVRQDSNGFTTLNRAGMTIPPAGPWRDNATNSEYDAQVFSYGQPKVSPSRVYQHQKRRSSLQHIFQTSSTPVGHQSNALQGGGGGSSHSNSHGVHTKQSLGLSLSMLPNLPPAVPPTTPRTEAIQWAVVRVTNIPWDISLHDMLSFVSGVPHPPEHLLPQNVHILMDRATGKTFNSAFIELAVTPQQARIVVQSRHQKILKGRMVTVEVSSQDELMRSVFPKWPGEFVDGEPVIPGEQLISLKTGPDTSDLPDEYLDMNISVDSDKDIPGSGSTYQTFGGLPDSSLFPKMSLLSMPVKTANGTISGSSSTNSISAGPGAVGKIQSPAITPAFVSRDEINALLVVCRNYKLHFSRKCAERPFENIISILVKYPWHQPHRVLPLHRDHIFELLKLSIESLRLHLSKENNTIDPTLLTRIVRSAILSPAFTERQKAMVLHVAGCSCPEDIVGWMTPPGPVESETAKDTSETDSQEDGSQDDTDRDSQETVRPSPRLKEVDTQIEGLAISDEIHMSPCLVELPNSPQLVKDGDQAMPPGGTSAPNIVPSPPVDTDHDLAQSLKSSAPPTPSPGMSDDDESNDSKDTSNLDH